MSEPTLAEHSETAHIPDDGIAFLSRKSAGAWLQKHFAFGSEKILAKLAWYGVGPISYRMGAKVLYKPEDLRAWAMAQISPPVTSASDNKRRKSAAATASNTAEAAALSHDRQNKASAKAASWRAP